MAIARRALAAVVADLSGSAPSPAGVRTQWRPTDDTDIVAAESAVRLDAVAPLSSIVDRLRRHGWNVDIREVDAGAIRLVGAGRVDGVPVGVDVGLWTRHPVTVRTVVPDVHVGVDRATQLIDEPVR